MSKYTSSAITALLITLTAPGAVDAHASIFRKKNKTEAVRTTVVKQEEKDREAFKKELAKATAYTGMFDLYHAKDGKLLCAIPDSAFNSTYLLVNRVTGLSNTGDMVAGQMVNDPMLIRFTHDKQNVYLHIIQTRSTVAAGDPIKASFDRNFLDPIARGFKIKDSIDNKYYIDVTKFFGEDDKLLTPIKDSDPLAKLLSGRNGIDGTFNSDASAITSVKAFAQNIQIQSQLAYTTPKVRSPYTVMVSRTILRLPDDPMPARIKDNRIGFFSETRNIYSSDADNIDKHEIITRYRLRPRDEDRQDYFAGKLVEPQEKITFYVDSAFPERLRHAVKEGIEYWNTAFEAAGFKNAIQALDYPVDDPEFDPDDIKYSCVRYCVTPTANAMGPSYVDPRTGEILGGDVIWYHNILSLLHNWRFTQTAAIDPRVRVKNFCDSIIYESVTYAAAHEIGHCLGLMHNMGASYAYSIDNLRDPAFTQQYGTTPSIMDYARNNYVAQPGDLERGVRLTPPPIGVYDIHAIKWGYTLIDSINSPRDEKPILDRWIAEKANDAMYEFGAQQVLGTIDPTDQTEDLGNDHMTAGDLAISNLRIIIENLEQWTLEPGESYDNVYEMYRAIVSQYLRHVGHVYPYIGGVEFKEVRQGDGAPARVYLSQDKQQRAINWLLEQARTNSWLAPDSLTSKFETPYLWQDKLMRSIVSALLSPDVFYRIDQGARQNPADNYDIDTYIKEVYAGIFKASNSANKLNAIERQLQNHAIDMMTRLSGLQSASASSQKNALIDEDTDIIAEVQRPSILCSGECRFSHGDHDKSFFRLVFGEPTLPLIDTRSMMTGLLKDTLKLYRKCLAKTSDKATRNFYEYQILQLTSILEP